MPTALSLTVEITQACRLVEALYRDLGTGHVEIRSLPTDRTNGAPRTDFLPVAGIAGQLAQVAGKIEAANAAGRNIYFGICPRRTKTGGTRADVRWIPAVWADVDGKNVGGVDAALARVRGAIPAPSAVVCSGHGAHAYWFLKSPGEATPENITKVEAINRGLARAFGGDAVHDVCRILRLPGTWNVKDPAAPVLCELLDLDDSRRYDLADFDGIAVEEPTRGDGGSATADLDALIAKLSPKMRRLVLQGATNAGGYKSRSEADSAVVCTLVRAGADDNAIRGVFARYAIGEKARGKKPHYLDWTIAKARQHVKADTSGGNDQATDTAPSHATGGPYRIENGRITFTKDTPHGPMTIPLTNFTATVAQEIVRDDGIETTRHMDIQGTLDTGTPLPPARIPAEAFNGMIWVTGSWGVRARIAAGQTVRDRVREAIQIFSGTPPERRIFTHTGWRKIGGNWRYLSASGALGADGIDVELEPKLARYALPLTPVDPAGAMAASLRFLDLGPYEVTVPVWSAVWLAVLAEWLRPDLTIWLYGPTGSLKTTIATLALSHFGVFDRTAPPETWESTANALERARFLAKDALLLVDDYAPQASTTSAADLEAKAHRTVRSQGNLTARGRLRSDLSSRTSYVPRGLLLSTGEQYPGMQSVLSRMLVVEIDRGQVDRARLTAAQAEAEHYSHALADFLLRIAPRGDSLTAELRQAWRAARDKASLGKGHLRVPEIVAHLWVGFQMAMRYAVDTGACDGTKAASILTQAWDVLLAVAIRHGERIERERPSRRFLEVLGALLRQGKVTLNGFNGPPPEKGAEVLGWADGNHLYLNPVSTFNRIARFCMAEGAPFPVAVRTLYRHLVDEGLVVRGADGKATVPARNPLAGEVERVLKLPRTALDGQ